MGPVMRFCCDVPASGLGAPARSLLRARLGAEFTDEDVPRPGWSWLCPDRRVSVSIGDRSTTECAAVTVSVWAVGDEGTDDAWVLEQVAPALAEAGLVVHRAVLPAGLSLPH